jgi:DNA-binding transcriptional LysR family regulator
VEVFCAVADTGSTGAAASIVFLSQSATSSAIIELERMLGLALFDRIGKRLVLNAEGRALLPRARALLDGALGMQSWANERGELLGSVHIGASTTIGNYLLPEILARMSGALPALDRNRFLPRIKISNTAGVIEDLLTYRLDLALIEGPCTERQLMASPWREDELVVVASSRDPLAARRSGRVPLEHLRAATWLLREAGSGTRETIDGLLLPHLHQLRPGIEFGNSEAIKRAVSEGLGISCLPRCVVEELVSARALVILRTALPPLKRLLYLVTHKDKQLTPGLEAWMGHLRA